MPRDPQSIVAAYSKLFPYAQQYGSELKGPCPVCGGTDRFWLNVQNGNLGCRGCRPASDNPRAFKEIMRALGLLEQRYRARSMPPRPKSTRQRRVAAEVRERRYKRQRAREHLESIVLEPEPPIPTENPAPADPFMQAWENGENP